MVRNVTSVEGDRPALLVTYYGGDGSSGQVLRVELLPPFCPGGDYRIEVRVDRTPVPSLLLGAALVDASNLSMRWVEKGEVPVSAEVDVAAISNAAQDRPRTQRNKLSLAVRAFAATVIAVCVIGFIAAWAGGYIVGGDNAFGGK